MVIEKDSLIRFNFFQWLLEAVPQWFLVVSVLFFLGGFIAMLISIARRGPSPGLNSFFSSIVQAVIDIFLISPRRTFAIAFLAFKESLRSRVYVIFLIFLGILAFAGWFLDRSSEPARLYISFVMNSTSYLVLMLALFLSVFSIPNDIKSHTVYTLVTKPIRSTEIVLGKTIGFAAVGTILMSVMAVIGYVFIDRMLTHTHIVQPEKLTGVNISSPDEEIGPNKIVQYGRLQEADGHFHTFSMNAQGRGISNSSAGHWHVVTKDVTPLVEGAVIDQEKQNQLQIHFSEPMDPNQAVNRNAYQLSDGLTVDKVAIDKTSRIVTITASSSISPQQTTISISDSLTSRIGNSLKPTGSITVTDERPEAITSQFKVSAPIDMFRARVPKYGKLSFVRSNGKRYERGISVGNVWGYHSYISGGTQAAAIWEFDDVSAERLGGEFPLELTLRVFRTHTGSIHEGVQGNIYLINPKTRLKSTPRSFKCQDGQIDRHTFIRKLQTRDKDGKLHEIDLFDDLIDDGKILVVIQCLENGQYFGMAQADAYLMERDGSYAANYFKGFIGVWLQMLLVICFGVMLSTFLSGPIALLASVSLVIFGTFREFIERLPQGKVAKIYGGGPVEQFYRIISQMNSVKPIKDNAGDTLANIIQNIDWLLLKIMAAIPYVIPSFDDLNYVQFVADGFDIQWSLIFKSIVSSLGYMIPIFFMGYYFFKHREVAA